MRQAEADDADADEEDDDFLPDATERDIDDVSVGAPGAAYWVPQWGCNNNTTFRRGCLVARRG